MTGSAQVLFVTIALAALTLSTAHAAAPATESDWAAALKTLTRLKDQPQRVEKERATLDSLETAIRHRASGASLSRLILDTALSLGELRAATRTGDPYELLSIVRNVGDRALLDRARRERLAAAFLAADLPWSAVDLLDPIKSQLGDAGHKTLSDAALALRIIRDDAASVAPGSTPYHGLPSTGARLLDLLGVPLKPAGPYNKFTSELAERVHQSDASEDRQLRGSPLLEMLLGAAKPQPVEDQFKVTSERLSPMHAAADSPDIASLSRVMHPADDDPTTVESDAGILARFVRGRDSVEPLLFAGSVPFRGGSILQFDVEDGIKFLGDTKLLLIAIERGSAGVDFYSFELDGWSHSPAEIRLIDDNGSGVQIGVSTSVGSGHFMTLRIFDPATGRLWHLVDSLGDGRYSLLRLGGGVPFAVLVSAEDDRRFTECMHCPARFVTALVRFEPSTRTYAAVAERRTGTDVSAGAVNLLGLSPKMFDDREREEDLFDRLSNHSPGYIAGDLVKDVDAAVGFINSRYCADHEFSAAAQKYQLIIEALSADGDSAAVRQSRAEVQITLLVTLISSGDYKAATALAQDPDLIKAADNWVDTHLHYLSAVANLALATGDYSRAYRLLREWRESGTAASEGTFTWFLTSVGDYRNARTAGLRALNRATAGHDYRYVATDMLHLANAAQHLGRTGEAVDWLSRALRIARGSDLEAFAFQIAADIALQNRLPGIATLFLDQTITTVDETVWDANGGSILLLYGKVLERRGDATIADLAYQVAAERGRRERGSALITADSVRADLAARRGDMALALKLSKEAFCTVLDGRSRIGQEYYKLSFIAIPQSVGAQYRRLHAKAGARPHCDRMKGMSPTL
jgi:tetratricopeptide (TPR) repeat protein